MMGFLFAETQKERELYCEFAGRSTYRLSEEHTTLTQGAVKLTDQQAILVVSGDLPRVKPRQHYRTIPRHTVT